jgi:hypothetical protein
MRLRDLNPKLVGTLDAGYLRFDCPYPGHGHVLRVRVHRASYAEVNGERTWQASGEYPDTLTLHPSINADTPDHPCWHGFITNGEVA